MKCNALVYLKQMMKYNSKDSKQHSLPKYSRHKKLEQFKKDEVPSTADKEEDVVNKEPENANSDKNEENKGILLDKIYL